MIREVFTLLRQGAIAHVWFTAAMSLTVTVLARYASEAEASGEETGQSLAAGFESWRTKVWGSAYVRSLGAEYLPQLAGSALRVQTTEMAAFLDECALLREHLDAIAAVVDVIGQPGVAIDTATGRTVAVSGSREAFREQISLRLSNIEAAARRALAVGGEIVIE